MDVTLKKVTAWAGAIALGLGASATLGTGVLASWDWVQESDGSHVVTAENKTAIERIADLLEGMRDERCMDLVRACMRRAQESGSDPLPCLEIECARRETSRPD